MAPRARRHKRRVSLERGVLPAYHTAMDDEPAVLSPLDPRFLRVLRWRGGITGVAVLAIGAGIEAVLYAAEQVNGIAITVAAAIALWAGLIAPARRFVHWRFALTDRELHVAHGWWLRTHTIVPIGRVQHIDLTQGPIERMCGVATLVLHTAGTEHAEVDVPGLARDHAEAVRDRIRAAIEASPW